MSGALPARHDPPALTWEPVAVVASLWVVGAAAGLVAARMVAAWLTGHGWVLPADVLDAVWGVVSGRPQRGFPAHTTPPPVLVVVLAVVLQVAVVVILVVGWRWFAAYLGVGVRRGLATATQAKAVLGVGRLRSVRFEVRPDLHVKRSPRWSR